MERIVVVLWLCFNPRTYIRYDGIYASCYGIYWSFNPRTYIRYADRVYLVSDEIYVSIHVPI